MNDKELLENAILYGKNALMWRRKFVGLLPEINRRRLFEKKKCGSIYEFAAKFGGLSNDQVRLALNLEERFESLPHLHELLVEGKESINKLARIVSIAKPENEKELSELVQKMSKSAIETIVRDEKFTGLPGQTLTLNDEVTKRLIELQEKGIDVNEIITAALNKREEEIEDEKSLPVESAKSHYVPVKTRRLVGKEFGTKCSIPTCKKPAEHIHHTQIFALSHTHDPRYLAPLCKEHHAIAHAINLKVQEKRMSG